MKKYLLQHMAKKMCKINEMKTDNKTRRSIEELDMHKTILQNDVNEGAFGRSGCK
jgi:hypothetical protein